MLSFFFFFFNDTATTEIYTLSLHDALPISIVGVALVDLGESAREPGVVEQDVGDLCGGDELRGRAIGRSEEHTSELQSPCISYAVFCLKKKKQAKHREDDRDGSNDTTEHSR